MIFLYFNPRVILRNFLSISVPVPISRSTGLSCDTGKPCKGFKLRSRAERHQLSIWAIGKAQIADPTAFLAWRSRTVNFCDISYFDYIRKVLLPANVTDRTGRSGGERAPRTHVCARVDDRKVREVRVMVQHDVACIVSPRAAFTARALPSSADTLAGTQDIKSYRHH
jgi:hypothetical protein